MKNPFRYFNSSPEVIRLAVMMYVRYHNKAIVYAILSANGATNEHSGQADQPTNSDPPRHRNPLTQFTKCVFQNGYLSSENILTKSDLDREIAHTPLIRASISADIIRGFDTSYLMSAKALLDELNRLQGVDTAEVCNG